MASRTVTGRVMDSAHGRFGFEAHLWRVIARAVLSYATRRVSP